MSFSVESSVPGTVKSSVTTMTDSSKRTTFMRLLQKLFDETNCESCTFIDEPSRKRVSVILKSEVDFKVGDATLQVPKKITYLVHSLGYITFPNPDEAPSENGSSWQKVEEHRNIFRINQPSGFQRICGQNNGTKLILGNTTNELERV